MFSPATDPSGRRMADSIVGFVKELVVDRGYTNLKYLVIGNEPDLEIAAWHGMEAYVALYQSVDRALAASGLADDVVLMGPDMGGRWSFMEEAIDRLHPILEAYDFHRYAPASGTSNLGIDGPWETLWTTLDRWRDEIVRRDPEGARKPLLLTEMGMDRGSRDRHPLIDTYEYALHMADYGTTLLTTRLQAAVAWTAHDVYFDRTQFMRWGMWKYPTEGSALRPWAQTYALLVKYAPPGSWQAPINGTPPSSPPPSPYRAAAVRRPNGRWSIFLVNRSDRSGEFQIRFADPPRAALQYFRVDAGTFARTPDSLIVPALFDVESAPVLNVGVPGESFVVLVERED
jgi:hypothetical protein